MAQTIDCCNATTTSAIEGQAPQNGPKQFAARFQCRAEPIPPYVLTARSALVAARSFGRSEAWAISPFAPVSNMHVALGPDQRGLGSPTSLSPTPQLGRSSSHRRQTAP